VVTVNHDAGEALLACVDSVLASTIPVEVRVVDNASRDGSLELVRRKHGSDPRVRILENDTNLGFARANNQALREAAGEYVLLLNPDCVVQPQALEAMRAVLEEDPGAGMAGCLLVGADGREQPGCRRRLPTPGRGLVRALGLREPLNGLRKRLGVTGSADFVQTGERLPEKPAPVEAISGAFMLVRRRALAEVGLLDEGYFLHCEDLDWCARFGSAGWRILFVPGVTTYHEKGRCSRKRLLLVQWHMHRGMARFYRKHLAGSSPRLLTGLVLLGVWSRFGVIALPRLAWQRASRARPAPR
jgi:hypothetical protein